VHQRVEPGLIYSRDMGELFLPLNFHYLNTNSSLEKKEDAATARVEKWVEDQLRRRRFFKGASFDSVQPFLVYSWSPKGDKKSSPRFELGRIIQPTGIYSGEIAVHAPTVKKTTTQQYASHVRVLTWELFRAIALKHGLRLDVIDAAIAACPAPKGLSPFYEGEPRLGKVPRKPEDPAVDVELVIPLRSRAFGASRDELEWLEPLGLALYERLRKEGVAELATQESGRGSAGISMLGKHAAPIMRVVKNVLREMKLPLPAGSQFRIRAIDSDRPRKRAALPAALIGNPAEWVARKKKPAKARRS
jgi:hypothetical protein